MIVAKTKTVPMQLSNVLRIQPHTDNDGFCYRHRSSNRDRDADELEKRVQLFMQ